MSKKKISAIMIGVIIVAIAVTIFMSIGENKGEEIDESKEVSIEQKLEYGADIKDKTFTFEVDEADRQADFAHLNPEVNTMETGKTEHKLELENVKVNVTIIVEDTQFPVIKGVKETIEFEGEQVDIEKELGKLITAQDPVDGELDVVFDIEEDKEKEKNYGVTANATDANGNKTTEKFNVMVKIPEKEVEKEKQSDKKMKRKNHLPKRKILSQ